MGNLNLNSITTNAFIKMHELDQKFIGSFDYIGLAYFWSYEYRHYLRDASIEERRLVHNNFLNHGLTLEDASEKHFTIIKKILKTI
jgi:hypothetical protein